MGYELGVVLGCRGCGEVWERCGRVYGVSVEVVSKWGSVRCGEVWAWGEPTHSSTLFPTPSTLT